MTTQQVRDRSKDVTRRDGWFKLAPGTLLCAVEKGMGLKRGEKVVRLGVIRVKSNTAERLDKLITDPAYGVEEMRREGFPDLDPAEFVRRFNARGIPNHAAVSRIEFEYVGGVMAEASGIAWTRSTFNPWIGCTKVSPGCDHCYAENQDSRKRWGGVVHWGPGVPRMRTSPANWHGPGKWNKQAPSSSLAGRAGFWPVFCASLADVFDNEVDVQWRADLMKLIEDTPNLSWLLVTKRIGNVARMVEEAGDYIDRGEGWQSMWGQGVWPDNVRLMITAVNQEEVDRDVPKLLSIPCKNGISYEPALGPVDWSQWLAANDLHNIDGGPRLDWIIVGGESAQGAPARPFDLAWARSTVQQCTNAGVPVFVKQLGSNSGWPDMRDRAGSDPAEWPDELRVQEFPL